MAFSQRACAYTLNPTLHMENEGLKKRLRPFSYYIVEQPPFSSGWFGPLQQPSCQNLALWHAEVLTIVSVMSPALQWGPIGATSGREHNRPN